MWTKRQLGKINKCNTRNGSMQENVYFNLQPPSCGKSARTFSALSDCLWASALQSLGMCSDCASGNEVLQVRYKLYFSVHSVEAMLWRTMHTLNKDVQGDQHLQASAWLWPAFTKPGCTPCGGFRQTLNLSRRWETFTLLSADLITWRFLVETI